MSWNDGVDRSTGYIVTATNWNDLLGASGSLMQLKSHAHGGTTGEGSTSIGPLVKADFTDAAAPAAPGAGQTRIYTVSGRPRYRPNGGADRAIITDETTAAGDLAGTYPSPTVAKITLGSDADGDIYYRASSVLVRLAKGTALQSLRMNAGATAPEWAAPKDINLVTEQATTSGTSIDFTGIPAGVKRITVLLEGVSTNGTSNPMIQIGDSGGIETSGYAGSFGSSGATHSAGFQLQGGGLANLMHGVVVLHLKDSANNTWTEHSSVAREEAAVASIGAGSKSLSGVLDRVRLTTVNGTDTFDAGSMSIMYE